MEAAESTLDSPPAEPAADVRTERLHAQQPTNPARAHQPKAKRAPIPVAIWALLGAVALVPLTWLLLASLPFSLADVASPSNSAETVEYPVIDGELGEHLEQLQRTVEP
jgi:hypothetical protein